MIYLAAHNADMYDGFWMAFKSDFPGVEIVRGDVGDVEADCYVFECDAFGHVYEQIMNPLVERFGWNSELRAIKTCERELPVGSCKEIPTQIGKSLIVTPIIRVFGDMARTSVDAYVATKSVMQTVGNRSVVFPGFGVKFLGADFYRIPRQMRRAIEDVREDWTPVSSQDAIEHHMELLK